MTSITPEAPVKPEAVSYEPMAKIREWHEAGEVKRYIEQPDAYGRKDATTLRLDLIREEFKEVADELLDILNGKGDRVKLAKELADLLYVTYAAADVFEIPLPAVFDLVHASNMTKVGDLGKVMRSPSGKILKGPNYVAPDIASVVLDGVSS